ES
ncbi:hypothetical protein D022_2877B, partial [Vibrio parahaemolyticus 12310]